MSDRSPSFSLLDAARILARGADLPTKLAALADQASLAAGGADAVLLIHDPDAGILSTADGASQIGTHEDAAPAIAEAVRDRRPSWSVHPDPVAAALTGGADRQAIVPLVIEDELGSGVEGVLLLATDDHGPDETTRETLGALGDLGAVAIRQARLHNALAERAEYLERLARTDALTGLADKRTFDQMLELEIARATRQGSPLAIAMFDVDGLTTINAEHGASVGDDVLRHVAATIADKVRLIDTVARIGEDEFGVIAPGDAGGIVARRVQEAVKALPPVGPVQVSISAAVVHHPVDGESGADLVAAAHAAIEQARSAGPGALLGLREPTGA
ncbi:MAG: diguanylate cyclase [Chloroflexota bacterium]